jgi:hypothetical protein
MCDQTFQELSDEAFRLVRTSIITVEKKEEFANVGEEVKALKRQIDTQIQKRTTLPAVASQR